MKIEERGLKDEVDLRKQYFSLHFSAFTISITRRLRLLAWPIWAAAPLVQARRAPLFYPLVPSSFRP